MQTIYLKRRRDWKPDLDFAHMKSQVLARENIPEQGTNFQTPHPDIHLIPFCSMQGSVGVDKCSDHISGCQPETCFLLFVVHGNHVVSFWHLPCACFHHWKQVARFAFDLLSPYCSHLLGLPFFLFWKFLFLLCFWFGLVFLVCFFFLLPETLLLPPKLPRDGYWSLLSGDQQ